MLHKSHGLPDFSWYNIPKREKMFPITIKYTIWPQHKPPGSKIDFMAIITPTLQILQNLPKLGFLV
jgi:protoporphyrinogen oxidase